MSAAATVATAVRVLQQVRHDPRTVGLVVVVPSVLVALLAWVYRGTDVFDRVGPAMVALFPFVVMFVVTSVTTLRERQTGTLERLMTTPLGRGDLVAGYAIAFGLLAVVQAVVVTLVALALGLDVAGPPVALVGVAVLDAVLGTALGLAGSAFAATELQAVQLMPAFVLPQVLLCGLLRPREDLPDVLRELSSLLPLSHAVDLMSAVTVASTDGVAGSLLVVVGYVGAALVAGALTLRRRTP
ncbi:ABC transporter permease [Aquipuribacter nitratireducens]|uniref:Transport permease protein n=1 Tax=Aquipuribacter nitratireducens TaxID=650104 RepID=A0ABW0GKU1_9MICO